MTKAEQARRMAWRFKVLQQACRAIAQHGAHVPAFRDFSAGLLPVEAAV